MNVKARGARGNAESSIAAGPDDIALSIPHLQAFSVGGRPARARQPQAGERGAARAQTVALRRETSRQPQLVLLLVQNDAAILDSGEGEAPAIIVALDRSPRPAGKAGTERRADRVRERAQGPGPRT